MKRFFILGLISLSLTFGLSSCIYEVPGDKFYRTLWNSSQAPLGQLDVDALTLEFLCGEKLTIKDGSGIIIAHGTYTPNGNVAAFGGVTAVIDENIVNFVEAHRNGDTLFLIWKAEGTLHSFTTAMKRLSSYE